MMPETSLSIAAPAKINLYLHIVGRRKDGFHLLDSLIAFVDLHDMLSLTAASELSLKIDGPFASQLTAEPNNLVLRAARGLARICGVSDGAHLQLTKSLPIASGIGGGSSDAAATLKGLMQLWEVQPDNQALQALAVELGADVPVCLYGQNAFMGGIGEKISKAGPLPLCSLVLVNSGVAISTPAIFKAQAQAQSSFSKPGRFDYTPENVDELVSTLESRHNDLAHAAQRLFPEIGLVLGALEASQGALMARMSGSGATCFALFADPGEAEAAAINLVHRHPNWWVRAGSMLGNINCPA
jgi:4-diphosphocytidyl-2-C-methyl-D-erythritol kinase